MSFIFLDLSAAFNSLDSVKCFLCLSLKIYHPGPVSPFLITVLSSSMPPPFCHCLFTPKVIPGPLALAHALQFSRAELCVQMNLTSCFLSYSHSYHLRIGPWGNWFFPIGLAVSKLLAPPLPSWHSSFQNWLPAILYRERMWLNMSKLRPEGFSLPLVTRAGGASACHASGSPSCFWARSTSLLESQS